MNLSIQNLKQKQEQARMKKEKQNERLKKLISNNNLLVQDLMKLDQTNTNISERLNVLKKELEYVEDLYLDLFVYLSNSYDQLKSLQEKAKSQKKSDLKENKKQNKKIKSKTIKEATTEEDIKHFKHMISFLLDQYEKKLTVSK